jgi:undecaprenyl-diphosphatase
LGGDALIVSVLKAIEHVTRPTNGILFDTGFSYPSGHSAGCIVFGGVLAYFAWRHWQKHAFESFNRAGIGAVVGVVGFDRIYLNVHWMSDVFGGWLFEAFWLTFVILLFRQVQMTGKVESESFGVVANWLYVVAVLVAVFVVLFSMFGNLPGF